jgi:hypothetical protein
MLICKQIILLCHKGLVVALAPRGTCGYLLLGSGDKSINNKCTVQLIKWYNCFRILYLHVLHGLNLLYLSLQVLVHCYTTLYILSTKHHSISSISLFYNIYECVLSITSSDQNMGKYSLDVAATGWRRTMVPSCLARTQVLGATSPQDSSPALVTGVFTGFQGTRECYPREEPPWNRLFPLGVCSFLSKLAHIWSLALCVFLLQSALTDPPPTHTHKSLISSCWPSLLFQYAWD